MILLKKCIMCFAVLMIMAIAGTASAKSAELTAVNAFDLDSETVRIEISYDGGQIYAEDITTDLSNGILRVELDNTSPGRVSRISGTKITSKDFVEKIIANKTKSNRTSVQIHFKSPLEGNVNFSLEPASRADKKDACIVLDVKKAPAQVDDWTWNGTNNIQKIIVLDPGHGGSDAGAIGPTGVTEKSVSLAVSLKAQKLLTASGYKVIMTRTTDIDVAAPGVSDATELQARVDKAPPNADLFISVHCNAFSNGSANGVETYHAPTAVKGERLARLLNEELLKLGGLNNRGVKAARFYVMTHSKCPASLIELGFITNPREEKLLASNDYQQKLAQAINNAVNRYFNQGGID